MKSKETEGTATKNETGEGREMKLKSRDIKRRRDIFYDDSEAL